MTVSPRESTSAGPLLYPSSPFLAPQFTQADIHTMPGSAMPDQTYVGATEGLFLRGPRRVPSHPREFILRELQVPRSSSPCLNRVIVPSARANGERAPHYHRTHRFRFRGAYLIVPVPRRGPSAVRAPRERKLQRSGTSVRARRTRDDRCPVVEGVNYTNGKR